MKHNRTSTNGRKLYTGSWFVIIKVIEQFRHSSTVYWSTRKPFILWYEFSLNIFLLFSGRPVNVRTHEDEGDDRRDLERRDGSVKQEIRGEDHEGPKYHVDAGMHAWMLAQCGVMCGVV